MRVFILKVFNIYARKNFGYFRLFGYGICWHSKHKLTFSERIRKTKYLTIGNLVFVVLKKIKFESK